VGREVRRQLVYDDLADRNGTARGLGLHRRELAELQSLTLDADRLAQEVDVRDRQPQQLADPEPGAGQSDHDGAPPLVER
jgi:hypothetical protein